MTFLNIYIAFSLLVFVLILMQSYMVAKKIKREHPDDTDKLKKKSKKGFLETIFSYIKIFITCFVPIINILIFCAILFKEKEVEEKVLNDLSKSKTE